MGSPWCLSVNNGGGGRGRVAKRRRGGRSGGYRGTSLMPSIDVVVIAVPIVANVTHTTNIARKTSINCSWSRYVVGGKGNGGGRVGAVETRRGSQGTARPRKFSFVNGPTWLPNGLGGPKRGLVFRPAGGEGLHRRIDVALNWGSLVGHGMGHKQRMNERVRGNGRRWGGRTAWHRSW